MQHELISFPANGTYNIIDSTLIHAHPAKHRSYPKNVPAYITVRKKGGIMENIYSVDKIIEMEPGDLESFKRILSEDEYISLSRYISLRSKSFGFGASGPYRFYFLHRYKSLNPPKVKSPNPMGFYYSTVKEIESL